MTVLALLFLGSYAVSVLWRQPPSAAELLLGEASAVIWLLFAVDLFSASGSPTAGCTT